MRVPNLASRPFLNTRPVWVFTAVAVAVGLALMAVNAGLFMSSNTRLEELLERRDALEAKVQELKGEVRQDVAALEKVPWKRLRREVASLNTILEAYGFSWQRLLRDMGAVLPRQVRLQRITPAVSKEGLSLGLKGTAQSREAILDFLQNMIDDSHFERPLPRSETTPEEAGVGYEFVVKVLYHPEGEVE